MVISSRSFPWRTDNDIKNRWYNYLIKEHKEEILPKTDFWTEIKAASIHFVDINFASFILLIYMNSIIEK
jgi:hypothetical protein